MNAGVGDKYTSELIKLFEKEGEQGGNLFEKNILYLVVDRVKVEDFCTTIVRELLVHRTSS